MNIWKNINYYYMDKNKSLDNNIVLEEIDNDDFDDFDDSDTMKQLVDDFHNLQELQNSINILIYNQRCRLDTIADNISITDGTMDTSINELEEAKKYSFKYKLIVIGTTLGVVATGPLGGMLGMKLGGIMTTVSGGLFGGWVGYKIQKN